jgi:hypothetical protein
MKQYPDYGRKSDRHMHVIYNIWYTIFYQCAFVGSVRNCKYCINARIYKVLTVKTCFSHKAMQLGGIGISEAWQL